MTKTKQPDRKRYLRILRRNRSEPLRRLEAGPTQAAAIRASLRGCDLLMRTIIQNAVNAREPAE